MRSAASHANRMNFVSHAQNFEDVMLWRALGHVQGGFYIDVGACEPDAESVTAAFYERGWTGINIEPAAAAFGRLAAARRRDINLQVAAGDREGEGDFLLVNGGNGLSTLRTDLRAALEAGGWAVERTSVPVRRLAGICAQHVRGAIHFLKIDVEGAERAVLAGADLQRWRPWIVVVEATQANSTEPNHGEWEDLLLTNQYALAYADGLNRFYVAAEHAALAEAMRTPPNVFDRFVRVAEERARHDLTAATARAAGVEDRLAASIRQLAAVRTERDETAARLAAQAERVATLEATSQADREAAQVMQAAQADRIRSVEAERDAAWQEMFESNRVAGALARERQALLDQVALLDGRVAAAVAAVHASTSWRITAPLRSVVRWWRR